MYNCLIDVITTEIEAEEIKILKGVEAPEDCELRFNQPDDKNPDKAYIFGSVDAYLKNRQKCGNAYIAVVTDGSTIPDNAELWVIPNGLSNRAALIEAYFRRFAEKIKESFDKRRFSLCLETAMDSVPDLVWFKDVKGAHLMVNNGFCEAVEKTKKQIYKKGHYYIWDIPKEEYDQGDYVCLESEEIVINAGETCLFDEKVKTKSGMRQYKTYKSPLYDINGELFGTCGIAKDVTDLHKIYSELEVVLESVPFGIFLEDINENLVTANKALESYFPDVKKYRGQSCAIWKNAVMGEAEKAGINEFAIRRNGVPRILKFSKEPIHDIFGEIIGRVIIFNDVTAERIFQKKTIEHANTDFLTGLNNRRALFDHLGRIKDSKQISMITVDLDNFKKVNDSCGHKMGDRVLIETGIVLNECFSEDFIARLGGDEFLVVINREVSADTLRNEAQSFIDLFIKRFSDKPELSIMTASVGISTGYKPSEGEINAEGLMYSSDSALYEAKKGGKSRLSFYKQ